MAHVKKNLGALLLENIDNHRVYNEEGRLGKGLIDIDKSYGLIEEIRLR